MSSFSPKSFAIKCDFLIPFPQILGLFSYVYFANIRRNNVNAAVKLGHGNSSKKREKFKALAEARTNKAIEAVLRIGNLSNRQVYDYEEAEVRKVVRALKDAIAIVEARFESPRSKSNGGFKL
jgi:hypothetical protein